MVVDVVASVVASVVAAECYLRARCFFALFVKSVHLSPVCEVGYFFVPLAKSVLCVDRGATAMATMAMVQ